MQKPDPDGLEKCVGAFGRWQFSMCVILYIVKIPVAFHQLLITIIAPPLEEFTCANNADQCAPSCSKHVFDRSMFTDTIVMTWDLVCDRKYLISVLQSLTMAGILTGNLFGGFISDRCGRKYVLIFAIVIQVASGCLAAFVPWLWLFAVLKFINAASTGGTMLTSFVLIMEVVGLKYRTIVGAMYQIPFCIGHLLLAPIAYYLRDWRHMQLACSLPIALVIPFLWMIPESPRWLISVGKRDRAIRVLTTGAKFNRRPTEDITKNVDEYIAQSNLKATKGGNIKFIFQTKRLSCKFFLVVWIWFNCGFGYFGVSQFIGYLKGDFFLNIAVTGAAGIPGMVLAVIFIEFWGRKSSLCFANTCASVGMFAMIPFMDHPYVAPACASFSIFGYSISFSTAYTYTGELFPTVVRGLAIGIVSVFARCGSTISPHIFLLSDFEFKWVIPVIFGSIASMALLTGLWLPETKDCKLPDTVEDSENYKITIKFNRTVL